MNDNRIKDILDELDREVKKDGAVLHLECISHDGLGLAANKNGYLRLAAECLRASIIPIETNNVVANSIAIDLKYLMGSGSDFDFVCTSRREDLKRDDDFNTTKHVEQIKQKNDLMSLIGCAFAIFATAMLVGGPWLMGVLYYFDKLK